MSVEPDNRGAAERLVAAGRSGRLDGLLEAHGVTVLTVFGSAVRGHPEALGGAASEPSPGRVADVDVAVAFAPEPGGDMVSLLDELARHVGRVELDGLDLDRAGIVARAEALTRCVPVFEAEPGAYAARQVAAVVRRMDTRLLRQLDLEVLAAGLPR